jgi:hypothetical protein
VAHRSSVPHDDDGWSGGERRWLASTVVKDAGGWVMEQWDIGGQRQLPMMRCSGACFRRETMAAGVDTRSRNSSTWSESPLGSPWCSRWMRGSWRMAGAAQRREALVMEEVTHGKALDQF